MYVWMSVDDVYNTTNFESLDVESLFFCLRELIQGIRANFVYEGHQVKVKVTVAKSEKFHVPAM